MSETIAGSSENGQYVAHNILTAFDGVQRGLDDELKRLLMWSLQGRRSQLSPEQRAIMDMTLRIGLNTPAVQLHEEVRLMIRNVIDPS